MKLFIFYLLQWTWGLSQNIVGGIIYLLLLRSDRHTRESYHGARITYVDFDPTKFGGLSLGMFVFICKNASEGYRHDSAIHELGHCVQSILLGPLYWLVVAAPSVIWCNFPVFDRMHNTKETKYFYYKLYCETWANAWGADWSGGEFITPELLTGGWFATPWENRKK